MSSLARSTTTHERMDSILRDGRIRRMGDRSAGLRLFGGYPDAHAGHGHDGGKPTIGGRQHRPLSKFVPEDYVIFG